MPRRKTKTSTFPMSVIICFVLTIIFRVYTVLPPNEEVLSTSNSSYTRNTYPNPVSEGRIHGLGKNEQLIFVHIGKAAGETIQWRIKLSCQLRKSRLWKEECYRQFVGEETELSKATIGYLHCNRLRPHRDDKTFDDENNNNVTTTTYMFSLRNPIGRIISWYQYMHPENCFPDRPSAACNLKKGDNPWGIAFYRRCFPTINDFVRSMGVVVGRESMIQDTTNCTALALETVRGEGPPGPSNHMYYNYQYYANRTITQYPNRKTLVVRQESLWDDLRSVESYLGGDPHHPFETQGPTITHGSERFRYRARLDPMLVVQLCCAIPKEISTYTLLLKKASNLGIEQKASSLKALFHGCGSSSLKDLTTRCGWDTV